MRWWVILMDSSVRRVYLRTSRSGSDREKRRSVASHRGSSFQCTTCQFPSEEKGGIGNWINRQSLMNMNHGDGFENLQRIANPLEFKKTEDDSFKTT